MTAERRQQLERLERELDALLALLRLEPENSWVGHFAHARERARVLREAPSFTSDDLTALSTTVTALFDPKDAGFSAWSPPAARTEPFEARRRAVYEAAFELRVVGRH